MAANIQAYLETLFKDRDLSWALVALLAMVAGLILRGWFLNPLFERSRMLDRKKYHEIKRAYFKHSFPGWSFFICFLVIACLLWRFGTLSPLSFRDAALLLAMLASLVLSILLHLMAFGLAALSVLKESTDIPKIL